MAENVEFSGMFLRPRNLAVPAGYHGYRNWAETHRFLTRNPEISVLAGKFLLPAPP
jgi:hypothetical protein